MEQTTETNKSVLDGTDLILSLAGNALGFSTGCKVSTTTETGERVTKEASAGKWKEKFVKSFSESISAEGCVLTDGDEKTPTYDQLKQMQLEGKPIEAQYSLREGSSRNGKAAGGYRGSYIITSLELDGQAGDDAKYSVQLENSGPVLPVSPGGGLSAEDGTAGLSDDTGGQSGQSGNESPGSGSGSGNSGSDSGSGNSGSDSGGGDTVLE